MDNIFSEVYDYFFRSYAKLPQAERDALLLNAAMKRNLNEVEAHYQG